MKRNSQPAGESSHTASATGPSRARSILDALAQMCPLVSRLTGRRSGCDTATATRREDAQA